VVSLRTFFHNFKVRLALAFVGLLLIPALIVAMLAYHSAKDSINNEIINAAVENTKLLDGIIDSTIQPKINDVNYFAETIMAQSNEDQSTLRKSFTQYVKLHPEVVSVYIGTADGEIIQEPNLLEEIDFDPRQRNWYKAADERNGDVAITTPYVDRATKKVILTVAKKLKDGSGVVAVDLYISDIQKLTEQVKIGKKGYAALLDKDRNYIVHPTAESGSKATESIIDLIYQGEVGHFPYELNGESKEMTFASNELTGWKIVGVMFSSEVDDAASKILHSTLFVLLGALLAGAVVIYFVTKAIMKPIRELKEKAMTISKGDLTEQIVVNSNDEIGQLGQAFNEMQNSLRTLIQKVEINAELVAASAEELTSNVEQTGAATERVAISVQEVAGSADKQMNVIGKNVQSLAEVRQGVGHIANRSSSVADLTQHATLLAEDGGKAVQNTKEQMTTIYRSVSESNTTIQSLRERSHEISSILDVITGIAVQTNLLSLNAAIEAARAGEHGKGFAVVAGEVGKLAEQSQTSAKQIFEILKGIQHDTANTVHIMEQVTNEVQNGMNVSEEAIEKFKTIVTSMREISPQIEAISVTAHQMSEEVQEVSSAADQLALFAKENAATSEDVAASTEEQLASMEEISASARSLAKMAEELKELISTFTY